MNHLTPYFIEGAVVVGMLGFMWKIATDASNRSATLFKRFDQFKEDTKRDHVSKDVCAVVHETINRDLQEIKTDVKTLLNREHQ